MPTAFMEGHDRRHATKAVAAMSDAKSILLIDDNHKDRQYYAQQLKLNSPDYVIFEALTGQAGLDLCHSQSIDCVILELGLPDMSGFEVLTNLIPIPRQPKIPVVVLTGFFNQSLLKVAKMEGAFATLQKGTTSGDDLGKVVHEAIATIPVDAHSYRYFDHA
jgi:DNA-binding NarL/FixJ family response regulator